jgi:hypothetical protein
VERWIIWLSLTLSSWDEGCLDRELHNGQYVQYLDFQRFNTFGVECACGETKVSQFDVTGPVDEKVLWWTLRMDYLVKIKIYSPQA